MTQKIAACLVDGKVVNTAVFDTDISKEWLKAIKPNYDKVLIVETAGIDWEEYEVNKLRPPMPIEENKNYTWDEPTVSWVEVTEQKQRGQYARTKREHTANRVLCAR